MRTDWLPGTQSGILDMAERWVELLTPQKAAAWGLPSAEVNKLVDLYEAARERHAVSVSATATDGDRERWRLALAALTAQMRRVNARWFFLDPLTTADFVDLGLPPPDTVRTAHTVVDEEVENEVQPDGIRCLAIHFKILGADHRAKPVGYDGAVTIWNIGDEQPMHNDDYQFHEMASRTPHRLVFNEEDRGKKVWIKQAWQNERGIIGRWSEALFGFVP